MTTVDIAFELYLCIPRLFGIMKNELSDRQIRTRQATTKINVFQISYSAYSVGVISQSGHLNCTMVARRAECLMDREGEPEPHW